MTRKFSTLKWFKCQAHMGDGEHGRTSINVSISFILILQREGPSARCHHVPSLEDFVYIWNLPLILSEVSSYVVPSRPTRMMVAWASRWFHLLIWSCKEREGQFKDAIRSPLWKSLFTWGCFIMLRIAPFNLFIGQKVRDDLKVCGGKMG